MRTKRGGAMLFVLVMVGLMTIAVLASVELSTSAATMASRREAEARARYAFEGAVQLFLCDFRKRTKSLPNQSVFSVGDLKVDLKAVDNSASKPHTVRFDGTTVIAGRTYAFSDVTGHRLDPTPLDYALFINGNLAPSRAITLGASGSLGDVSVNGAISSAAIPFTVNGDVESTGTTLPSGAVVTGNVLPSETVLPFPAPNSIEYLAASLLSLATNSLTNYLFPGTDPYPLLYRVGDLDLKGTITGRGTIYATGTVNIPGDLTYADANSRIVVIAGTGIRVRAAAKNVVGMFYTTGPFQIDTDVVVSPGAVAAGSFVQGGTLTIVHDPSFWNDRTEGAKHRAPGYWP